MDSFHQNNYFNGLRIKNLDKSVTFQKVNNLRVTLTTSEFFVITNQTFVLGFLLLTLYK